MRVAFSTLSLRGAPIASGRRGNLRDCFAPLAMTGGKQMQGQVFRPVQRYGGRWTDLKVCPYSNVDKHS